MDTLYVTSDTSLNTLDVSGATTMNTLRVTGDASLNSLDVSGATTMNTLRVTGDASLNSLDISGLFIKHDSSDNEHKLFVSGKELIDFSDNEIRIKAPNLNIDDNCSSVTINHSTNVIIDSSNIILRHIPDSSLNLPSGYIYNDNGVLKIA